MYTINKINKHIDLKLHTKINLKSQYEQTNCYLFPYLYGNKPVTKNTIGNYKEFDNSIARFESNPLK